MDEFEDEGVELDIDFVYEEDESVFNRIGAVANATSNDPFAAKADDYRGSLNRSMKRRLTKASRGQGSGGAGTKSIKATAYAQFGVVTPDYNPEYLSALYEKSAPNAAAIDAKVANIVGLGHSWIETDRTAEKLEGITDEDELANKRTLLAKAKRRLEEWMEDLNDDDFIEEILQKMWTDVESIGWGCIEVGRTTSGQIGYVGHIPAKTVRVRANRDGYVQISGMDAVFFRNFGDTETANPVTDDQNPNELMFFTKYTPNNSYYGIPDVVKAIESVAGNKFASKYNLEYFENKAVPRYALIIKGGKLSKDAERSLAQYWRNNLKGQSHGTLVIPVPASKDKVDVEFKPIEASVQEASFVNYFKLNREEILMAHRVPPEKVGVNSNSNNALGQQADKTFKEQVCHPAQRTIEKKLSRIFREKQNIFKFKLNELTLTDEKTQAEIDEKYVRLGIKTRNEVRVQRWGWKGLPGGDEAKSILDKPETADEAAAQTRGTRSRDIDRESGNDKDGGSREPKGGGS